MNSWQHFHSLIISSLLELSFQGSCLSAQTNWIRVWLTGCEQHTWLSDIEKSSFIISYITQNINKICWLIRCWYNSSSVQSLSCAQLFATPWTEARQDSLSITNSRSPPKFMSIELVMPSNHLIFCRPLLLLPSIFPNIRVFTNESALCIRWPKYWSLSFNICPSNEYSGLISFKMDCLDLLAVQEALKSLLQHHSTKVSILWHSAFFIVQLSHPYVTTGKTMALTRWTFVGKKNVSAFLNNSHYSLPKILSKSDFNWVKILYIFCIYTIRFKWS